MSAGPADIANQIASQQTSGQTQQATPSPRLFGGAGIVGGGAPQGQVSPPASNTGAARFLPPGVSPGFNQGVGMLRPTDFQHGNGGQFKQPGMPQDFDGKFGGALRKLFEPQFNPQQPQYNPDAQATMGGGPFQLGRQGLLDRRIV